MAEANAEPGAGDVIIVLAGKDMVLKPTLEACMAISKLAGNSLAMAVRRCEALDFEFVCEVIAHGIGETSSNLKKQVQQAVYEAGVISVAAECILFIRVVMNGGKPPPDYEEVDDQAADPLARESGSPSENSIAD